MKCQNGKFYDEKNMENVGKIYRHDICRKCFKITRGSCVETDELTSKHEDADTWVVLFVVESTMLLSVLKTLP